MMADKKAYDALKKLYPSTPIDVALALKQKHGRSVKSTDARFQAAEKMSKAAEKRTYAKRTKKRKR